MIWATCEKNWVKIVIDKDPLQTHLIRDLEAWDEFFKNLHLLTEETSFLCSSSLDWPRDTTDNYCVIQVCNAIRGNTVT